MIESEKNYHLVHTILAFARNEVFLRKIQFAYGLEIPFIDHPYLSPEFRDALDTYIYLEDVPDALLRITRLQRQYSQVTFTRLGLVSGQDILQLISTCEQSVKRAITVGGFYKILQGPHRNLHVTLVSVQGDIATVSYQLLSEIRTMFIATSLLDTVEPPKDPLQGFRNLTVEDFAIGKKAAVIIDGSFALHKACFGYDKLYTKNKRFVGGAVGYYFELLRLKELYPERQIQVVFDGHNAKKSEDNPDYKAGRFEYQDKWYEAYNDNLAWCFELTKTLGFHLFHLEDQEGDDVVGSLAHHLTQDLGYYAVLIFSKDQDFFSIIDDKISLIIPKKSFRGHSQIINPEKARDEYKVNRNDKINWVRSLMGDTSDNIPSVNHYYQKLTGEATRYQSTHYLPHINEANTLEEAMVKLKGDSRFFDFIDSGAFLKNLNLLTIKKDLFSSDDDLSSYKSGDFDYEKFLSLLEEMAMYKEVEQANRVARILQGIW